jgi:hypothetical protein
VCVDTSVFLSCRMLMFKYERLFSTDKSLIRSRGFWDDRFFQLRDFQWVRKSKHCMVRKLTPHILSVKNHYSNKSGILWATGYDLAKNLSWFFFHDTSEICTHIAILKCVIALGIQLQNYEPSPWLCAAQVTLSHLKQFLDAVPMDGRKSQTVSMPHSPNVVPCM